MNAEDLQSLYNELRGSRSAPGIMDARSLFLDLQYEAAMVRLKDSQAKYRESRARILKQDPKAQVDPKAKDAARQIRRLERKQEKAKEILETFDELIPQLEKLIKKEKQKEASRKPAPQPEPPQPKPKQEVAEREKPKPKPEILREKISLSATLPPGLAQTALLQERLSESFIERFGEAAFDDQLNLVGEQFDFREVESEMDVIPRGVYLLRDEQEGLLVSIASCDSGQPVELVNLVSERAFHVPMEVWLEFASQRKVVLLLQSERSDDLSSSDAGEGDAAAGDDASSGEVSAGSDDAGDHSTDKGGLDSPVSDDEGATNPERDKILDMGALSQLMDAAQRSGLVPGADQIAYVRDKEFRLGQYEHALQMIESMYGKFTAAVAQRSQRLMREDADIASGRLKMSPKELQAKRSADRTQDQLIERARSRFNRVLDGLRVLLKVSTG